MATAVDPGELGMNRAREIVGFVPGRNGKLQLSKPLQRILQSETNQTVSGLSYYYNPQPPSQVQFNAGVYRRDRLVVVKNGNAVYLHTVAFDKAIEELTFGPQVFVGNLLSVQTGGLSENQNIRTVQYQDELFIVAGDGSTPMRLYLDASDNPFLYPVGISSPNTVVTAVSGGAGVVNGDVIYYHTDADEKGRESSPSAGTQFTAANNTVDLSFAWPADPQVVQKFIYRTTAGGSVGYRIATIPFRSTVTWTDNAADDLITSGEQLPEIGSNEPPKRASCIEFHKGYLCMNNRNIYDNPLDVNSLTQMQMSNLDDGASRGVTQFNLVPENINENSVLGLQIQIGNRNSDELRGLKSNGSVLACGTRDGWWHVYGDSPASFVVRYQSEVGIMSTDSLVEGDGMLFYLSATGFQMTTFDEGFIPRLLSEEIQNIFIGTTERV